MRRLCCTRAATLLLLLLLLLGCLAGPNDTQAWNEGWKSGQWCVLGAPGGELVHLAAAAAAAAKGLAREALLPTRPHHRGVICNGRGLRGGGRAGAPASITASTALATNNRPVTSSVTSTPKAVMP